MDGDGVGPLGMVTRVVMGMGMGIVAVMVTVMAMA